MYSKTDWRRTRHCTRQHWCTIHGYASTHLHKKVNPYHSNYIIYSTVLFNGTHRHRYQTRARATRTDPRPLSLVLFYSYYLYRLLLRVRLYSSSNSPLFPFKQSSPMLKMATDVRAPWTSWPVARARRWGGHIFGCNEVTLDSILSTWFLSTHPFHTTMVHIRETK